MRYYRRALILPLIWGLVSTACEPNASMSVENPPTDTLIVHAEAYLDRFMSRLDSTIIYINGVRVDSTTYANFDFTTVEIEMIREFRDSAAVERFGSSAEGRIVKEYTVKPRGEPQKPN